MTLKRINNALMVTVIFCFTSFLSLSQCLSGDCENGQGVLKCDCGYIFEGQFQDGKKIYGTLTKEDLVYTGDFKNDVAHGQGEIHYADSSWYVGSFVQNYFEGYGKFCFSTGETFTGQFKAGQFSGLGVLKLKSDSVILGQFAYDQPNGWVVEKNASSRTYLGRMENGQKSGLILAFDSASYEISFWKNGTEIQRIIQGEITAVVNDSAWHKKEQMGVKYVKEHNLWVVHLKSKKGGGSTVIFDSRNQILGVETKNLSQEYAGITKEGKLYTLKRIPNGGLEKRASSQ